MRAFGLTHLYRLSALLTNFRAASKQHCPASSGRKAEQVLFAHGDSEMPILMPPPIGDKERGLSLLWTCPHCGLFLLTWLSIIEVGILDKRQRSFGSLFVFTSRLLLLYDPLFCCWLGRAKRAERKSSMSICAYRTCTVHCRSLCCASR